MTRLIASGPRFRIPKVEILLPSQVMIAAFLAAAAFTPPGLGPLDRRSILAGAAAAVSTVVTPLVRSSCERHTATLPAPRHPLTATLCCCCAQAANAQIEAVNPANNYYFVREKNRIR